MNGLLTGWALSANFRRTTDPRLFAVRNDSHSLWDLNPPPAEVLQAWEDGYHGDGSGGVVSVFGRVSRQRFLHPSGHEQNHPEPPGPLCEYRLSGLGGAFEDVRWLKDLSDFTLVRPTQTPNRKSLINQSVNRQISLQLTETNQHLINHCRSTKTLFISTLQTNKLFFFSCFFADDYN